MTKNLELAQFGGKVTYDDLNEIISLGTDVTIAGIATATTLYATNGTFSAGIDTGTDVGFILEEESSIYTRDAGLYLRNLIQKKSDNIIIGQQGTVLINGIELKPGSAGPVKLHHGEANDNVKLQTTTSGIEVTGTTDTDQLNVTGVSTFQSDVHLGDNDVLNFGAGNDLQIYHSADNASYIRDAGTGNLNIDSVDGNIQIRVNNNEYAIVAKQNSSVELYYDNSKKLETTDYGIYVTGAGNTSTIGGAANLVLDPLTVGDNTGTVTILGDLQVEGTQTIINSTTLEVDDKLVSIAKSATNASQADGAGLEINGASAKLTYASTGDKWVFNKAPYYNTARILTTDDEGLGNGLDADTLAGISSDSFLRSDANDIFTGLLTQVPGAFATNVSYGGTDFSAAIRIASTSMRGGIVVSNQNNFRVLGEHASFMHYDGFNTAADCYAFRARIGTTLTDTFYVTGQGKGYFAGNVGIGTDNPTYKLHINDTASIGAGLLVQGGGSGGALAKFERIVGGGGTVVINCGSQDPQIQFASPDNVFVLGVNGSNFEICDNSLLGTNQRFVIDSSGNFGIGTDNPLEKLHVKGGNVIVENTAPIDTGPYINFVETGYNDRFGILAEMSGSGDSNRLIITANNSGNSPAAGDHLVVIEQGGNIGVGVSEPTAKLNVSVDNTSIPFLVERTDAPTKIEFNFSGGDAAAKYTVNNAASYLMGVDDADADKFKLSYGSSDNATFGTNDLLSITSSGNIGIGTDNPVRPLHITSSDCRIRLEKIGETTDVELQNSNGNAVLTTNGESNILLQTNNEERLRITSDGNVGINFTEPTAKLDVNGDVSIASTVSIGTTIDIIPYNDLGTLSFEGSSGQLFSITNNLTSGSIFSVNDVSGIPSIDVDADGTIQLGAYGGNVGIGLTLPTHKLDINANSFRVRSSKTPATAGAAGTTGEIAWDTNYIYVCTATNTWKRAALSTW